MHDLSRSGVNHRVRLPERVVLPRLSDVMDQTLRLLRDCPDGMELGYMVLDFSDAFKQLRGCPGWAAISIWHLVPWGGSDTKLLCSVSPLGRWFGEGWPLRLCDLASLCSSVKAA